MKAGSLNHKVIIQQSSGQDTFGGAPTTYTTFWAGWVKIESLSGQELLSAQAIVNTVNYKITMRYKTGVNSHMRLVYGSRIFMIEAVLNLEEGNREMHLLCRELL